MTIQILIHYNSIINVTETVIIDKVTLEGYITFTTTASLHICLPINSTNWIVSTP